ncbi:hypothetical protein SLS63_002640, partial [Diaporthe eres]
MAHGKLELDASQKELCTVFCTPPSTWWTDVHYACSTIQLCTTRNEAEKYHERHGFGKGDIMSAETLWELSLAWYGDKHTYEYTRKTPEEAKELYN